MCLNAGLPCTDRCSCTGCQNDLSATGVRRRNERQLKLKTEVAVRKYCTCKKNQCKLKYCLCFARGLKCDPVHCQCDNCSNREEHAGKASPADDCCHKS